MKKALSILFIACGLILSCTKNAATISKNDLSGTWKLTHITGGFAGIDSVPKDDITITFKTGGTYNTTLNDTLTGTGNYSLAKAPEPNYYYSSTIINLIANANTVTYGIGLSNDSLYLSQGCCDQFGYTYVKQK